MGAERLRARFAQDPNLYPSTLPPQSSPRIGSIPGISVGATFETRAECCAVHLHSQLVAGISGTIQDGAYSIVMSGGYEDDQDYGESFIYTGTGGRPGSYSSTGPQMSDQSFYHHDNRVLKISADTQQPVRVIRGPNKWSKYAPESGFRYDGLYRVEKAYLSKGRGGFIICQYELQRIPGQPPLPVKDYMAIS